MITPTFDMKKAFFDSQKIKKAVDRQTRKALSKSLAFVRRRMRSGLRRRKKVSQPGQSPSVHSKHPVATLKYILFAYDESTKSGVVGPMKINGRSLITGSSALPGLLEAGGTITIPEYTVDGNNWRTEKRGRRVTQKVRKRKRTARIQARPFVAPALAAEVAAGNIASPWANVVTG